MSTEEAASPEPTEDEVLQAVYTFTAEQMEANVSHTQIVSTLVEKGIDEESASTIVEQVAEARREAFHSAGKKNMIFGALWAVGGTVVTIGSYSAVSEGGGRYVVAWGAVIFGVIQFFRGLSMMGK